MNRTTALAKVYLGREGFRTESPSAVVDLDLFRQRATQDRLLAFETGLDGRLLDLDDQVARLCARRDRDRNRYVVQRLAPSVRESFRAGDTCVRERPIRRQDVRPQAGGQEV